MLAASLLVEVLSAIVALGFVALCFSPVAAIYNILIRRHGKAWRISGRSRAFWVLLSVIGNLVAVAYYFWVVRRELIEIEETHGLGIQTF